METSDKSAESAMPSNSPPNVRSKVSSWVSNFVCDMRIKSPAIINKWVDPTPIPSADCSLLHTNHSSIKNLGAQNCGRLEEFSAESNQISEKATEVEQNNIENILDTDASNTIEIPIISDNSQTDNKNKSKFGTKFWVNPAFLPNLYKKTRESSPDGDSNDISVTNSESKPAPSEKTEPNKSRIEEFYALLRINREHYSYMVNRSMEAKKLIKNAKEKLRSSSKGNAALDPNDDATNENVTDESTIPLNMAESSAKMDPNENLQLRDPTDMDVSTDEYSHFTQSNENISGDDSFNHSPMQSITGAPCSPTHLNVGRKLGIGEIGRSTSDNPRLRNKYLLGDIGRSFSEHQDDEAIMIGERNISAPTSSIAIQSKPNGGFFERRAYSVSPTQKGLRRGMLSRDQSLSESSKQRYSLTRDGSIQSDSSHCSSVESLLDARKPDPEAILRQLGFGPVQQEDLLSRIPKRFLKPSQVPGIDTDAFMRQQQIASNLHEQSILGYRGLVGNPHHPPSLIVAKIMERFQMNDQKSNNNNGISNKFLAANKNNRPLSAPALTGPNLPDRTDDT